MIAQIEDAEALARIDEIVAVDGIDAFFVGRIDLTISLDCTSPNDARVVAAVDMIVAACERAGRVSGMFLPQATEVAEWQDKGATLFLLGSDHTFIRSGAQKMRVDAGLDLG